MENILDFTLEELKEWLISKEEKAFRANKFLIGFIINLFLILII